jgi:energy-coupling factor transporter ATP-binding protein EcfA2
MSTATAPREITIENVGPVKRCTIPIPPNGGIVVLKGRNGSGKSHVLDAVAALTSGDGSVPVRDGQGKATVEGLGATLRVSKRATRSGELEVVALEGGVDPSTLVDPGISDPEKADAQRIKALLTLARAEASPDQFSGLMAGVTLPLGAETDPVKLAGQAKRAYQARARDCEQDAELAQRESQSLEQVEKVEYTGPVDPKVLQAELETATRRKMELDAAVNANEAAAVRANEALARVRLLSDGHAEKLAAAQLAVGELSQVVIDESDEVRRIERDLAQAKARLAKTEAIHSVAKANRDQLVAAGETIAHYEAEIDKASGIVPVDPQAIAEATCAVENATDNIRMAERKRHHDATIEKSHAAKRRWSSSLLAARDARDAAAKCDTVLSGLIDSCGTGLFVDGGRLRLATDRGEDELYADLSHGERWRIAIDVCVASVGAAGLIVIPQEAFEGLDPVSRGELAQHAREVGVVILTAECDSCDLETEVI